MLYANTSVFMWKSLVFWFCTVWCLHTRCERRHFYTLRCPAPFWLIQCKPYRNRFITAKVIDKSLGARFFMAHCVFQCTIISYFTHMQNVCICMWTKLNSTYHIQCVSEKKRDYIFYNNLHNKCLITIIFGIASNQTMCHRKMVSYPNPPI